MGVEGVGGKVDKDQVDQELDDLEPGDPLLPPDADTARAEEVVPVHDHVDAEVQDDGDPFDGGSAGQLRVAEQRGRAVVVGVQEQQFLALEDQKHGVEQLEVLGQVVQVVQGDELGGKRFPRADCPEQTVLGDHGHQLLDEQQQQDQRNGGQQQVVQLEQKVELHRRRIEGT